VLLLPKPVTEIQYSGSIHPKAIVLNYSNYAFIKCTYDAFSKSFLKENIVLGNFDNNEVLVELKNL